MDFFLKVVIFIVIVLKLFDVRPGKGQRSVSVELKRSPFGAGPWGSPQGSPSLGHPCCLKGVLRGEACALVNFCFFKPFKVLLPAGHGVSVGADGDQTIGLLLRCCLFCSQWCKPTQNEDFSTDLSQHPGVPLFLPHQDFKLLHFCLISLQT